ncbi:MAG: hypothetical protein LBH44_09455 [Treponema sp.]|jgi:hypothetical protein|nr:hypothetical protein [Treponema sp.]
MIGFLIRKTIYDLWDNMFRIVLINVGFLIVSAIPVGLHFLFKLPPEIMLILGIILCSVYLSAAALSVKTISDYSSFGFGDFFAAFKDALPAGLAMSVVIILLFLMAGTVIPFYLTIDSPIGLLLAALVFWVMIFALLSLQFYFAVRARLATNLFKIFKKCFLVSLDNTGLAVFSLLHNFAALLLSAVFAFLFPGPGGILLFLDEALRLRLLKYDWLEANPGSDRRKIPWDALLIEEREKTGIRSLKNFIFPWKD